MSPPKKSLPSQSMTDAEIDALYGLEPVIGEDPGDVVPASRPEPVVVPCPYCGESFETSADASAGPCKYVEDCQVCCQPIEMEVRVNETGEFLDLLAGRGDAE